VKTGTAGFVGSRLREGREIRGLTAGALAEIVGVTRAAISQYELGLGSPRPEIMRRISQALNLPDRFFLRSSETSELTRVFYRSLASATKGARTRARHKLNWIERELLPLVEESVELPEVTLPLLRLPRDSSTIPVEEVDDLAAEVRSAWGLRDRPISNMTWLLENHGVFVAQLDLEAETLDSLASWLGQRPAILVNVARCSAARQRFDLAHELGHLLLHSNVLSAALADTRVHKAMEEQANRFAGAFLLPASSFAAEVYTPSLEAFRLLKSKWGASIGAMISRCGQLGILNPDEITTLWKAYSRRGWRRLEPLDEETRLEEPVLAREAIELLVDHGVLSKAELLDRLPFAASDIEDLASLPPGYLRDVTPSIRLLRLRPEAEERSIV
jgi:Zn-dependent peptidase ImmA (M78 family)/DNA-binding XRE family transcriptional regulator